MSKKLKECQRLAARLLAFGCTGRFVAQETGVREETISRWKQNQAFQQCIIACQRDVLKMLEERHFATLVKAQYCVEAALSTESMRPKDRVEIALKYLRLSFSPLRVMFQDARPRQISDNERAKRAKQTQQWAANMDKILENF